MKKNYGKHVSLSRQRRMGFLFLALLWSAMGFAQTPTNGLSFDGYNDYVNVASNSSLNFGTGNFTVEGWMYKRSGTAYHTLAGKWNCGCVWGTNEWLLCGDGDSGNDNIPSFMIETPAGFYSIYSPTPTATDEWHHYAGVKQGRFMRLYVDGILVASTTLPAGVALNITSQPVQLGQFFNTYYANEVLDEVRIWNVARTQAQISANMSCDIMPQSGLVAYYRFDQGTPGETNTSVAQVNDYSGHNNCGTLNNFLLTGTASNFVTGNLSSCNALAPGSSGTISGNAPVCIGSKITLSCTLPGGTWSASNGNVTVNPTSGAVTGVAAGTATVNYTLFCETASVAVTVNPTINPEITGTASFCLYGSTTLTGSPAGGTWSSNKPSMASVTASGVVTSGSSAGTARVSYTSPGVCVVPATTIVTVLALPVVGGITGISQVCVNATGLLTDTSTSGIWSSSNEGLATVSSSGTVTGISAGSVVISYSKTNSNGCSKSSTKKVLIRALPEVPAISAGTGTACAGGTLALSEPATGGYIWSSANAEVATVNAGTGVVRGISPGTAIISYTYTNTCTGYAQTVVTVNAPPEVADITGPAMVSAGGTITLSDATTGGIWTSSHVARATVNATTGVVSGYMAGTANITYTLTSCSAARVIKNITVLSSRGGELINAGSNVLQLYPNPTSGIFTIETADAGTMDIYAIDGKQIKQYAIDAGITTVQLPANLPTGIYICRYENGKGENMVVRLVYQY